MNFKVKEALKIVVLFAALNLSILSSANAQLEGQLGILDLQNANGGINPATGAAWAAGDTYRLLFVTSTKNFAADNTDINAYNTHVTTVANNAGLGGDWFVVGSTGTVDARDNTGTNPTVETGVGLFGVDGTTMYATDNTDIWNGLSTGVTLDQDGNTVGDISPATGSNGNGTSLGATGRALGGSNETPTSKIRHGRNTVGSQWMVVYNGAAANDWDYYAMSGVLTVVDGSDETPPLLTSFEDDKAGGPIVVNETVTYTVTFNEPMKASTVDAADFENASATAVAVSSASSTVDPAVFEVVATPTEPGTLQLQVKADAVMEDLSGTPLDTTTAIPDDTVFTVSVDDVPPTVVSFADDQSGGPIFEDQAVTYTVTFSKPMNASTVEVDDFANASGTPTTINGVAVTGDPAVFEVVATPGAAGTLQLQINAGATLEDTAGNALVTTSAIVDSVIITVNTPPNIMGELGILDVTTANGGINPATGAAWAAGDTYRLLFVTSTKNFAADNTDINAYNTHVTTVANNAGLGGDWFVVGSTGTVDARDNTGTNPNVETGVGLFGVDGTTMYATDNTDIWNGLITGVTLDQDGNTVGDIAPATGSNGDGTTLGVGGRALGGSSETPTSKIRHGRNTVGGQWMVIYNGAAANNWDYYAMSGVLTVVASGGPGFSITDIDYAPDAQQNPTVTLTWRKTGASSYIAWISHDLSYWGEDLDDSITLDRDENTGDPDQMTVTFPLEGDRAVAPALFFRIEEG